MKEDQTLQELMSLLSRQRRMHKRRKHGDHSHHQDKQGISFVLNYLYEHTDHEVTASELAKAMDVTSPRMTVILRECEQRELIQKQPQKEDKRIGVITLSSKGKEKISNRKERFQRRCKLLMEKIGPEDAQALVRILRAYEELKKEGRLDD